MALAYRIFGRLLPVRIVRKSGAIRQSKRGAWGGRQIALGVGLASGKSYRGLRMLISPQDIARLRKRECTTRCGLSGVRYQIVL